MSARVGRRTVMRSGMTLVELLVVVGILGLLAATVLPNLSNTAEARRSREAARTVSSFISKSQSRAIGRREWSGCTLVPAGPAGTQGATVLDLFLADVPAPYRGDTTNSALTLSSSTTPTQRTLSSGTTLALLSGTAQGINPSDLIRLDGRGPWYELAAAPTATSLEIRLRGYEDPNGEDLGYVPRNTPWPAAGTPHTFEIMRRPVPAGAPLSLSGGRAIDLFWSGFGPPFVGAITGTYVQFTKRGKPITILFDGSGRLRQVIADVGGPTSQRLVPTGPVFLLVGRADRCGQAYMLSPSDDSLGANWQYPDSYWIGIDMLSGVCKTAECLPDAKDPIDSQFYIRQALLKGG